MLLKFLLFSLSKILAHMRKNLAHVVEPEHYDLYIAVEEDVFRGRVAITVRPTQPVAEFQLNSKDLAIEKMAVAENQVEFSEDDEFVTVKLDREYSEDFVLAIDYSGEFKTELAGFYKSTYNGEPLYSTHFEPTDARRAFPCFDQPDMKSTFSVSIKAPEGCVALSNMDLLAKEEENVFVFAKTPKMSTYIVAFVIGKLAYVETDNKKEDGEEETTKRLKSAGKYRSAIPIRVYAHADEVEWGRFALDVATRCLAFYEKYFEIGYPLPKLDMVAIPSFAMGAMENWGLVTYRSTSLLFDEKTTPIRSKKNIAVTVCHELAHMWFGNLVTMEWWSDLWLNEGFATWAATLAVDQALQDILPWDAWTSFIHDDVEAGMSMDSLRSTHKIGIEVKDPVEIDQIFDAISYSKGSSIIKMLENWLGAEDFRRGLVRYLKKYSYGNSRTQDLWDALSACGGNKCAERAEDDDDEKTAPMKSSDDKNKVADVIDPWIVREGFPYVAVEEEGTELRLTQKRYTLGFEEEAEPWPIPIKIRWDDESVTTVVMKDRSQSIARKTSGYKLNDNVSGFYRTLYPKERLDKLLGTDGLAVAASSSNRMNLYNDAFSLAIALLGPLPLAHLGSMKDESNYDVLFSVVSNLQGLQSIFYDEAENYEFFRTKILDIVAQRADEIDFATTSSDVNAISLSSFVVLKAVANGHEPTLHRFRKLFDDAREHGSDLRASTTKLSSEYIRQYFTAVVDEAFPDLIKIYKDGFSIGLRQHALFALGCTKNEHNFHFLLDNIEFVQPHDTIYLFASFSMNTLFRDKLVDFYISDYERLKKHINNSNLLRSSLEYLFEDALGCQEKALGFLASLSNDRSMKSAVDKCVDSLELKSKFRKHYEDVKFN